MLHIYIYIFIQLHYFFLTLCHVQASTKSYMRRRPRPFGRTAISMSKSADLLEVCGTLFEPLSVWREFMFYPRTRVCPQASRQCWNRPHFYDGARQHHITNDFKNKRVKPANTTQPIELRMLALEFFDDYTF